MSDNNYPAGAASTIDANIGKHFHEFIGGYTGAYGAGSAQNRFWPSPGNHDWFGGLDSGIVAETQAAQIADDHRRTAAEARVLTA